ncbi:MAG: 30S ribosomal protein S9 [Rickettsiales bacterium]|nr:30S ribosomal protein S9 [Rickettsiales bacterium]
MIDVKVSQDSYATGRRKTSVARVWITQGSGEFIVNKQPFDKYFERKISQALVNKPFIVTQTEGLYNVKCTVSGGGLSGQAGALAHGLSRAIAKLDESFKPMLKAQGLTTRDSREVERKKPGLKKARKKFQFSKR